jgi:two-component system, LytTR family, response regulator
MKREITTILVDDEPLARQLLKEYLQDFPDTRIVGECRNGRQAIKAINELRPDLVFLDIRMPGMDGFEVLEHLTCVPHIIFSTAYGDYALKAFELNAIDYLLKPYDRQRFSRAVHKVIDRRSSSTRDIDRIVELMQQSKEPGEFPERIFVRVGRKITPVQVRDILWIEAEEDYSRLHESGGTHLCNLSLNALEKRLNPSHFMRVHRSHIVACNSIEHLSGDGEGGFVAVLKDGSRVRVGRTYAPRIREIVW